MNKTKEIPLFTRLVRKQKRNLNQFSKIMEGLKQHFYIDYFQKDEQGPHLA